MKNNYRPTWAEVNLNNLKHNYGILQAKNPRKTIIPIVKADAYGHGAIEVVNSLKKNGVTFFGVSLLEEALELRSEFSDIDIIALGAIYPNQLEVAYKNDIIVTIYSYDFGLELLKKDFPVRSHIKIDTGMNRLGIKNFNEVRALIEMFNAHPIHRLEGMFTHFATSDSNECFFYQQLNKFEELLSLITPIPNIIHLSNSSSIIKYEKKIDFSTHSRLGISLYGLSLEADVDYLKPVMTIKTRIVQIKTLSPGEHVGYGTTYTATNKERVGVLPIGYADGLVRKNSSGHVEINGKTYPFIGRICMDYAFIRIDENVTMDDEVIIMGGNLVTIDDIAIRLNTITYEIVTQISKRIPRVYIGKDD